jgi:hypothetical protein
MVTIELVESGDCLRSVSYVCCQALAIRLATHQYARHCGTERVCLPERGLTGIADIYQLV